VYKEDGTNFKTQDSGRTFFTPFFMLYRFIVE